jgi:hypothetical protein
MAFFVMGLLPRQMRDLARAKVFDTIFSISTNPGDRKSVG